MRRLFVVLGASALLALSAGPALAVEPFSLEYQIVDENRDSYEYYARYVMANGMLLSQNPTVTNQTDLTLVTP